MRVHEKKVRANLGQRITRVLIPALCGVILIGGFFLHSAVKKLLISQFDHALLTKARTLTSFPEPDREGINLGFTERPFPEFHPGLHAEYFQVWLSDGSILTKSPSLIGQEELPRPISFQGQPIFWSFPLSDGRPGRAVGLRLHSRKETSSGSFAIDLVLARDSIELNRVLRGLAVGIAAAGCFLLLLAWYGVRKTTESALKPVNQFAERLGAVEANSLKNLIVVDDLPPDLRPIADQINDLMKRLDAAFHRERRFAANAAHELLTPVAELRIAAENAIDWPDDQQATGSLAAEAKDLSTQMEHVVRTLLALSKAEAKMMPLNIQVFDLGALLHDLLDSLKPRLAARGLRVQVNPSGKFEFASDQVILRSVLSNLFANAAEYATEKSEIQIVIEHRAGNIELAISNRVSSAISSEDLARFCEAFWRGDPAHQSREHAGLGLALAKAFAEVLGGEIRFPLTGQSKFTVLLNLPDPPVAGFIGM